MVSPTYRIKKYSFETFCDKKSKIYFNRFIFSNSPRKTSLKYLIALNSAIPADCSIDSCSIHWPWNYLKLLTHEIVHILYERPFLNCRKVTVRIGQFRYGRTDYVRITLISAPSLMTVSLETIRTWNPLRDLTLRYLEPVAGKLSFSYLAFLSPINIYNAIWSGSFSDNHTHHDLYY